jgi:DNA (cytosine-5)-methyltransferase 1
MKHGSLFSGIGGFDLAAEWMGWENVFHCEWMEFPRKVLDYYWPNADSHIDICKTDFKKYANKIDILTGGFPCQPFSMAGKRKGTEDERYLWGEMLRAVQEIKPKYVIAENVFGITNIDGGLVFEQVCLDLEAEGYEVQPFIIPAAAKNAPHRRDRCWFIATNSNCNGFQQRNGNDEIEPSERGKYAQRDIESLHSEQPTTKHTDLQRQERRLHEVEPKITIREQFSERDARSSQTTDWQNFPTQSPICGGDDGLPTELDGITFSKWRAESIKGYGNAIVPQVALELFKVIEKINCNLSK